MREIVHASVSKSQVHNANTVSPFYEDPFVFLSSISGHVFLVPGERNFRVLFLAVHLLLMGRQALKRFVRCSPIF